MLVPEVIGLVLQLQGYRWLCAHICSPCLWRMRKAWLVTLAQGGIHAGNALCNAIIQVYQILSQGRNEARSMIQLKPQGEQHMPVGVVLFYTVSEEQESAYHYVELSSPHLDPQRGGGGLASCSWQ